MSEETYWVGESQPPKRRTPPGPKAKDPDAAPFAATGKRLRAARERAGFDNASTFARQINIKTSTYLHHENGSRAITVSQAMHYARFLDLTPSELLHGTQLPFRDRVPIVGTIMGGGRVEKMPAATVLTSNPITVIGLVAHIIVGDDLLPVYHAGEVVMHRPLSRELFDLGRLHGKDCVVELESGLVMLRQVIAQRDGYATLISYHAAPILNVKLVAGEPVQLVHRDPPVIYPCPVCDSLPPSLS